MKAVGIIAEYNPFHKGHQYHIEQSKKITGADAAIVVMSGDFVQRGEPAIFDKFTRTKMALASGADIVIELPVCHATGSAEYFAEGAVRLLDSLAVVDSLCFGSEAGNLEQFKEIAMIFKKEPSLYQESLKKALKSGDTFPVARKKALTHYLTVNHSDIVCDTMLLNDPNNILGIEYCKALLKRNSKIEPYTIMRTGQSYHAEQLPINHSYCSATAIRNILFESKDLQPTIKLLQYYLPAAAYSILKDALHEKQINQPDDYSHFLNYILLTKTTKELESYFDVSVELANRIHKFQFQSLSFTNLAVALKTKQYTRSRVNRALLHILLNIRQIDAKNIYFEKNAPYARLLGFQKHAAPLLRKIQDSSPICLITKLADAKKMLSPNTYQMLNQDIKASQLAHYVASVKSNINKIDEYSYPILIYP